MDDLTSPQGSVALAITALLLVLGFRPRLARGGRLAPQEGILVLERAPLVR